MSDKKFNFLNNTISCTITTIAWPIGAGVSKKCTCFVEKPLKSYRQLKTFLTTTKDDGVDCLFQAAELARVLSDKNMEEQSEDSAELSLLRTRQRWVKNMMLQYEKLKKLGSSLKAKVLPGNQKNSKGFDITVLIQVNKPGCNV